MPSRATSNPRIDRPGRKSVNCRLWPVSRLTSQNCCRVRQCSGAHQPRTKRRSRSCASMAPPRLILTACGHRQSPHPASFFASSRLQAVPGTLPRTRHPGDPPHLVIHQRDHVLRAASSPVPSYQEELGGLKRVARNTQSYAVRGRERRQESLRPIAASDEGLASRPRWLQTHPRFINAALF